MITQIMNQIPKEYKVATEAIWIIPTANRTLETEQQIYIDLWNENYKNKTQMDTKNPLLYANTVEFKGTKKQIAVSRKSQKKGESQTKMWANAYSDEKIVLTARKQKRHTARNCPIKEPKTANTTFMGIALAREVNDNLDDLQLLSEIEDFENKITL